MSVAVSACEADPEASPGSPSRKSKPKEAAKSSMEERRLQGVFICQAKAYHSISNVPAGNIAAFSGVDQYMLKRNTMSANKDAYPLKPPSFNVSAVVKVSVCPKEAKELPKTVEGLRRLAKSCPLVQVQMEEGGDHVVRSKPGAEGAGQCLVCFLGVSLSLPPHNHVGVRCADGSRGSFACATGGGQRGARVNDWARGWRGGANVACLLGSETPWSLSRLARAVASTSGCCGRTWRRTTCRASSLSGVLPAFRPRGYIWLLRSARFAVVEGRGAAGGFLGIVALVLARASHSLVGWHVA